MAPTPDRRRFQVFVDRQISGSNNLAAGLVMLPPKQNQPQSSRHPLTEEVYYIVKGRGLIELGEDTIAVEEGAVIYVPRDTDHRMLNTGETEELWWFFANTPPLDDYKPVVEGWAILPPALRDP